MSDLAALIPVLLVIGFIVIAVRRHDPGTAFDAAPPAPPPAPPPPPPPPPTRPTRAQKKASKAEGKAAKPPAPAGDPYAPPTFRVIALGAAGSGKTVFLASLFHRLNYQTPERSYYLETESDQRVALGNIFSTISDTSKPWPAATRQAETREFVFDCVARDHDDDRHRIMRVSCLEYAGELVEREQESPVGSAALRDLDSRIMQAHALLGVIDGRRVLQLMRGEPAGRHYFQHALQPMLGIMQGASCPIHLVLTKWDLVRDFGEPDGATDEMRLQLVIDALMRYEHIKSLVYVHAGGRSSGSSRSARSGRGSPRSTSTARSSSAPTASWRRRTSKRRSARCCPISSSRWSARWTTRRGEPSKHGCATICATTPPRWSLDCCGFRPVTR